MPEVPEPDRALIQDFNYARKFNNKNATLQFLDIRATETVRSTYNPVLVDNLKST